MIQIPVILFTLGFAAAIVNPEASLHPQPAAAGVGRASARRAGAACFLHFG